MFFFQLFDRRWRHGPLTTAAETDVCEQESRVENQASRKEADSSGKNNLTLF